ncbi:unnamed protein product, partial [Ectocarpus sp. 12 AP-2014]
PPPPGPARSYCTWTQTLRPIIPTISLGPLLLPYRPLVKAFDVTALRATCNHRYATAGRVLKLVRRRPEAVPATKYCWAPVIKWGRLKAVASHQSTVCWTLSFNRGKVGA